MLCLYLLNSILVFYLRMHQTIIEKIKGHIKDFDQIAFYFNACLQMLGMLFQLHFEFSIKEKFRLPKVMHNHTNGFENIMIYIQLFLENFLPFMLFMRIFRAGSLIFLKNNIFL